MIQDCVGYRKLLAEVERDEGPPDRPKTHDYRGKLQWIVDRVQHYADATGLPPEQILDAWEERRHYWYMNFYQESRQPTLDGPKVRVFDTVEQLGAVVGVSGFRCPYCKGVSRSPYRCDSGVQVELLNSKELATCNWGVGGLLGDLGKGVFVFVKEKMIGERIFMPVDWEEAREAAVEQGLEVVGS